MLRLTLNDHDASRPAIRVEGRLVGDWAGLLEEECSRFVAMGAPLDLDLAEVTDVDKQGLAVLRRLRGGPISFTGCTPLLLSLITGEEVQ